MIKLLIVDDSIFSQKVNASCIKKCLKDVNIYFAQNGKDGLEKYKKIRPDYIMIDLLMPVMSGSELIKEIKKFDNNAKIFVVSADVQKNVKNEIKDYIISFINKPINDEKAKFICDIIRDDKDGKGNIEV